MSLNVIARFSHIVPKVFFKTVCIQPSSANWGKIYFSIMQNLYGIRSMTFLFSMYMPALILLLMNYFGFYTKLMILLFSSVTTTPNLLGSLTVAKMIEAILLWLLWKSNNFCKGYSQRTSLLNTKKISVVVSFFMMFSANLKGPAVPKASYYLE